MYTASIVLVFVAPTIDTWDCQYAQPTKGIRLYQIWLVSIIMYSKVISVENPKQTDYISVINK